MDEKSNILSDEIQTENEEQQEKIQQPQEEQDLPEDIRLYEGKALTDYELYRLSARVPVETVLIAGAVGSGKTSLGLMMYFLFAEGRNQTIQFAGSRTIMGFRERAEKVYRRFGEDQPKTDRTSQQEERRYFHLNLLNEDETRKNFIFTDVSGEIFGENGNIEDLKEMVQPVCHLLLMVDGEKMIHATDREGARIDTFTVMDCLNKNHFIGKNTCMQVVCSKKDIINQSEKREHALKSWKDFQKKLKREYGEGVHSISFEMIASLNVEKEEESTCLERILGKCFSSAPSMVFEGREDGVELVKENRQFALFRAGRVLK